VTESPEGLPTYDILAAHEPESPRRPAAWWLVGAVVALVAALIGGITYGVASLSGGGTQPEDALPAGAIAFAKVDLDPPAGQKVDAIRFLRKFPSLRDRLSEDADLRKVLFDAVADDAGWDHVDFARDVKPWLGQRVGVAAYQPKTLGSAGAAAGNQSAGSRSPAVVVALQIGDEGTAREGLDRLIAATPGSTKPGYVIGDGYALLAENQRLADRAATGAETGTLAKASTFADDISDVDGGIATFWVNGSAASSVLSVADLYGVVPPAVTGGKGSALGGTRLAYGLRFDGPDVLELAGHVAGAPEVAGPNVAVQHVADLPASTVAALGLGGGEGIVDSAWASLRTQVGSPKNGDQPFDDAVTAAESQLGLKLPDDLKLLLGSNLLVALDSSGLREHDLALGARVTTSDPKRADDVVGRLIDHLGVEAGGVGLVHHATSDGYVVASSAAQATRLATAAGGKRLGDVAAFRKALPDVDKARFAFWVDVHGVAAPLLGGDGELTDLKPIAGFGLTATSDGSGNGSFRARLVTN
jgi:hypothetical protein